MFSKIIISLMLALFIPNVATIAQNGVGGIKGKIMGNLQPVSGAEVVLTQKDKVIDKTSTDENGNYSFPYLRPGLYDVKATKPGYRINTILKVPVDQDDWTRNDIYLTKLNNPNMPADPIVETYKENWKKYMRNK